MKRAALLSITEKAYQIARPFVFRRSAQNAHESALRILSVCDRLPGVPRLLSAVQHTVFEKHAIYAGGVTLPSPLILAAGLVKGFGFADESAAVDAVHSGVNIIPGWRSLPSVVGPVEFGSFTRWPRMGNPGMVVWRDVDTRSTQNYVGLKNPGAKAASLFLSAHHASLPDTYGINIAVSPGVQDPIQERDEVVFAANSFLEQQLRPKWFTLNISCPNTEDDPGNHQTEVRTRGLCSAMIDQLKTVGIPLWVKVSPTLSDEQYRVLMRVFAETGVKAVVATNTLPQPHPERPALSAGVGGGRLHLRALHAVRILQKVCVDEQINVDVIGCGGVQDSATVGAFQKLGVHVMQYWSVLVYRGPLAAALILAEMGASHGN